MEGNSSRSTERGGSVDFNNRDHTNVAVQGGYVHVDTIYQLPPGASAEEKFRTGCRQLAGDQSRRAEILIGEAVEGGLHSNEVAYYWVLSVLSDRSIDHLGQEELSKISACSRMIAEENPDAWFTAAETTLAFVIYAFQGDGSDDELGANFDRAVEAYNSLAAERREEIYRHLDLIMPGTLQDRLAALQAAAVREHRMDNDRAGRAWKFFEPDPCPPLPAVLMAPQMNLAGKIAAALGGLLAGLALLTTLFTAITHSPLFAVLFVAGTAGGGYLIAIKGRSWLVRREQLAADAIRHGEPAAPGRYSMATPAAASDNNANFAWGESDAADDLRRQELKQAGEFQADVQVLVDCRFAGQNIDSANKRAEWEAATRGLRQALATDIQRRYAGPGRTARELDWLIKWHAKRAQERWRNGTLRAERDALSTGSRAPITLGKLFLGIGLVCGLLGAFTANVGSAMFALLLGAAGYWLLKRSEVDVYAVQRDLYQAESARAAAEHAAEQSALHDWADVLKGRPADWEMSRWLDYDKLYAKNMAINTVGLANRDVISHAILTEAKEPCQRARVQSGAPRYSAYRIVIFLLTAAGVRQVSMDLDFLTGTLSNQQRTSFRYDAISAARITEVGVRWDSGRRSVFLHDGSGQGPQLDGQLIFRQAFWLSLMDGQHIAVVVENFDDDFLDRLRENPDALMELALDSSGITTALRVLESVAADGREWVQHEQARRDRRIRDYNQAQRGELTWNSSGVRPPLALEGESISLPG